MEVELAVLFGVFFATNLTATLPRKVPKVPDALLLTSEMKLPIVAPMVAKKDIVVTLINSLIFVLNRN